MQRSVRLTAKRTVDAWSRLKSDLTRLCRLDITSMILLPSISGLQAERTAHKPPQLLCQRRRRPVAIDQAVIGKTESDLDCALFDEVLLRPRTTSMHSASEEMPLVLSAHGHVLTLGQHQWRSPHPH